MSNNDFKHNNCSFRGGPAHELIFYTLETCRSTVEHLKHENFCFYLELS